MTETLSTRPSPLPTLPRKGRGHSPSPDPARSAGPPSPTRGEGCAWRKGGGEAPYRETKFAHAELTEVEADGSFSGYASLFGETDLNRDVVLPGAFLKSIRARGASGIR